MQNILEELFTLDHGHAQSLGDHPLRVLAEWYLTDCEARNLQPDTLSFYRIRLGYLLEHLGERKPAEVSCAHLRVTLTYLKENRHWSVQNTNHCVQVWKGFFNYLENEGFTETNPARRLQKLKQESKFPKPYTQEELCALLKAAGRTFNGFRDKTMMLVLLDTGVRLAELVSLTVEDVDLGQGVIRVFGKGRKERFVPFQGTVRRVLLRYLVFRGKPSTEALWVTVNGTPLREDSFQYQLRVYGSRAGLAKVHAHRFRHTFATEYLRNGGSPQMLQRILGHTTPLMTQRYVHITDSDAKRNHTSSSPVEQWRLG